MNYITILLTCLCLLLASPAAAQDNATAEPAAAPETVQTCDRQDRSIVASVLLYLPNRVCDVFDLVRCRLRVGPGLQLGAYATEHAAVSIGAYRSVWAGLNGPRLKPSVPWPIGVEMKSDKNWVITDPDNEAAFKPAYQFDEFGIDAQGAIVGVAVGISGWEILDLLAGFIGFDPSGDDF